MAVFAPALLAKFEEHEAHMRERVHARRKTVRLRSAVIDKAAHEEASEEDSLGRRIPGDEFKGDTAIRTLRTLLKQVDEKGFERSNHQLKFHSAFERSCARVLYRENWGTARPQIMAKHGWASCPSEVLVSTPRSAAAAAAAAAAAP